MLTPYQTKPDHQERCQTEQLKSQKFTTFKQTNIKEQTWHYFQLQHDVFDHAISKYDPTKPTIWSFLTLYLASTCNAGLYPYMCISNMFSNLATRTFIIKDTTSCFKTSRAREETELLDSRSSHRNLKESNLCKKNYSDLLNLSIDDLLLLIIPFVIL